MPLHKDLEEAADKLNEVIIEFEEYLVSRTYQISASIQMPTEERENIKSRYLTFKLDPLFRDESWGIFVEEHSKGRVSTQPLIRSPLAVRACAARILPSLLSRLEQDAHADLTVIYAATKSLRELLDNMEKSNAK